MRRIIKHSLFVLIFSLIFASANVVSASETDIWEKEHFDVEIEVQNDGEIIITETIYAEFFAERRGIFRDIPYKYDSSPFAPTQDLRIDVESVTDIDGNDVTFEVSTEGDYKRIRIGDEDIYITGKQTYVIKYKVKNALRFYEEHDELYWNVMGHDNTVNILESSVTVTPPEGIKDTNELLIGCYTGEYGSTEQSCSLNNDNGTVSSETLRTLRPYEGYTIIIGYPKGLIEEPSFLEKYWLLILVNSGILLPFPAAAIAFLVWNKHGKDPKGKGTIVPQFTPPGGLSPSELGALVDNKVDNIDISAIVIDLAIRKYIRIEEMPKKLLQKKTYTFHLLKEVFIDLKPHEILVMEGIFGSIATVGTAVKLSELENKFYTTIEAVKSDLYQGLTTDGLYSKNPDSYRSSMAVLGGFLIGSTLFTLPFLGPLGGVGTIAGVIVSGIFFLIISPFMPQRTAKGMALYEEIKGLKMYMEIAEQDRISTMQSPDSPYVTMPNMTVELFEKLLPYAMVLKLEKKWAEKFKDIYNTQPDWYSGGDFNNFNTIYMIDSISNATETMNSTFQSTPQSSSSGFSSGGGFSGGGGGGGGSSSW